MTGRVKSNGPRKWLSLAEKLPGPGGSARLKRIKRQLEYST